jgi:subtilisin family serine protease
MKLLKLLYLIFALVLSSQIVFSEYKAPVASGSLCSDRTYAYSIYIPGEKVPGGWEAAKIINIPYLTPDNYLPNAIHVKTKTRIAFDKNTNSVYSSTLMVDLNDLGIKKVRAPFAKPAGDSPLQAEPFGIDRILEIYYESDINPYDACRKLMNNPEVEYAVPVFVYQTVYTPNDPYMNKQWYVKNIKLKEAWDISKGSEEVLIGIVDSGTDWKHQDLADNIWTNPNEIPNNNIDDDHNGKIDDIRGWDLVGNVNQSDIGYGNWKEDNNPLNPGTSSNNTHGTHVSGCASAVTDNNKGIAGTGFKTKIVPVKCASDQNIRGIYRGYEGITYAANLGVDVINCSWGGPGYSPVGQDVINNAVAKGCVVVVATGNDGQNVDNGEFYPAGYDNVLAVGATRSNNRKASFSNWGLITTVYTPGQGIYATMPNNKYAYNSGTSMASPVTAGVAALVKALHRDWSPKQISHQLRSTSENVVTTVPSLRPYYYGRLNAYNALNYNHSGGPNIPGIEITKIILGSGDALNSYEPVVISLEVTNFLAPAGNVVLKIEPQNNFISVNTPTISVGNLGQMQTKKISLALELLKSNPWYEGHAAIIVTIEATNYTDYQLVKIPVRIESKNHFSLLGTMPELYVPEWMGAVSPSRDVLWAVGFGGMFGNNGGFYKFNGSSQSGKAVSTEYAFCVDALDGYTAWIGTSDRNGKSATIRKTLNGGSAWSSVSVTNYTTFINTIHFYDEHKGVFLGDPKNGKWGVGITNNGGTNWSQPQALPPPLTDEAGLAGCGAFVESAIWFGTNKGRVICSKDKGKTWYATTIKNAGQIWAVAISDENNGLAVYSDTGSTDKYIASTTNGGTTWLKNRYDFSKNKLNPIYFFTNPKAGSIYMLCSGGQVYGTKTNGATWEPVLTQYHGNSNIGAAADVPVSKMRMWDIGQSFSHLDFSYIPKDIIKRIELISSETINFDSATVGKFRLGAATIENTGNVPVHLDPEILPDAGVNQDEFVIYGFNNDIVDPEQTISIRLKFTPEKTGQRTAVLRINSDAEPNPIDVNLIGFGREPVSVDNIAELPESIVLSPNPATTVINISGHPYTFEAISIVDLQGRTIKSFADVTTRSFDVSGILSGTYFMIFETKTGGYYKKIYIIR